MVAEKYKKLKDKGVREMVRYAGEDIKQFLNVKGAKSENTKNTYERHIEQFVKEVFNTDMNHLTKDQLEMINYDLLQKFQNEMRSAVNEKGERIYKNSTINGKVTAIRTMLKFLKARKKVNVDIEELELLEELPKDSIQTKYVSVGDALEIADWLYKNEKHKAFEKRVIIYMLIETGNRIRQVLNTKWSDFENVNGKILLKNRGKGNKMKNEVIPEKLYEMLLKLKGYDEKVFSIPYGTMYDSIKRATKNLGLDEEIAAHSFKRTALTYVATSTGGNVMAIQKKGGHSTPQMAVYYAQEAEAVENGAFSSTYGIDQKLYESVDHSLLLEAIGNMNSDFKIMLNAELNRLNNKEK